jgi:aerobic-type carbon monoxide dehydrogenase small subunit (CoxS/CutS family)
MNIEVSFELNGARVTATVGARERLLDVLRRTLGATGTKEGCGEGECGACTVLVGGRAVNSCLFPAPEIDGQEVRTVEGLARSGELSPIQRAFLEQGGVQCGFCSPGMVMSAVALLEENDSPSDAEIREALAGNLCRCTGYVQIIDSIRAAAAALVTGGAE